MELVSTSSRRYDYEYLAFHLLYFSEAMLKHVIDIIADFRPDELTPTDVPDPYKLACRDSLCRYYMGIRSGTSTKPRE